MIIKASDLSDLVCIIRIVYWHHKSIVDLIGRVCELCLV